MRNSYGRSSDYYWEDLNPTNEVRDDKKIVDEITVESCLRVGDIAPSFNLQGVFEGQRVSINLSDYRGEWVVVFFYPSDFTFV